MGEKSWISFLAGHWLDRVSKMKFIILACLIFGSFAEPKAEADADAYYYGNYGYGTYGNLGYSSLGYSNLGYSSLGYSNLGYSSLPYTRSYGVSSYSPYVSTNGYGLRTLGKRSADAEPEAEADADAYYYGNYGYGNFGYSSLGYNSLPYTKPYSYTSRPLITSSLGYRSLGYAASPYTGHSYGAYSALG